MYGSSGKITRPSFEKVWPEIVIPPLVNARLIGTLIWLKRACVICDCESARSVSTLNGETVCNVQAVTLSSSNTLTQNSGSISIWTVGVVSWRLLQPLRIRSTSKRMAFLPLDNPRLCTRETFRVMVSPGSAVSWIVVDNVNLPDNNQSVSPGFAAIIQGHQEQFSLRSGL